MTTALNRFISRSAERCRPFFLLLHKWKGFEWTEECAVAFQQLKEYLSRPPIMSSPEVDEVLFAYLAVAPHVISFVLIREDNSVQRPVYYVNCTGRIAKWDTILGAFDIKYMLRTSVKGQVLADQVAEFAECPEEANMKQNDMDEKSVGLISTQGGSSWRVYVDEEANQQGAGLGLVLISPEEIIIERSLSDILPEEKIEVEKIRRKAPRFWLSEDKKLYKRSFFGPYLLCVHPEMLESLLEELHEGICGSHTGRRSLSHRAITQGYWWSNMQKEVQEYVRKCDRCQRFAPNIHQPGGILNPLSNAWPFAQWGLDIVGRFPKTLGNKKYLLVGTDYFTK
ncbi:uncharacterized protein LOC126691335 [Quercus robur]|uniref:uncharacterized protein LOC126691335 n=1 Tax=Quercus robur TaxID=38942 RepID=UPI0021616DDC|nr:uncharacterized protein LOC126691335 [Quercus robur]